MILNVPPTPSNLDRVAREGQSAIDRLAAEAPAKTNFNLIVLDESGSMQGIAGSIVRGFNAIVDTIRLVDQRYPDHPQFVSLVTFSNERISTVLDCEPVRQLSPLSTDSYRPSGSTPLYDALGKALLHLESRLPADGEQPTVLVNVITDGLDNASHTFYRPDIQRIIDRLRAKGWTFTYLGADHAVEYTSASLGIEHHLRFEKNLDDVDVLFQCEQDSREDYYRKKMAGMSSFDAERDYYKSAR